MRFDASINSERMNEIMTFTLTIKCDNAAFSDEDGTQDIETAGREIARILSETGDKIQRGNDAGVCHDSNGNRVGEFALTG